MHLDVNVYILEETAIQFANIHDKSRFHDVPTSSETWNSAMIVVDRRLCILRKWNGLECTY